MPVDTDWAIDVQKSLFLNSKEKALYAGSLFIRGTQNNLGKKKNALTPLYIHELELSLEDEVYFISIKETYFNPDFLELANNADPTLNLSYELLSGDAPVSPFGFDNHVLLLKFFKDYFKSWAIDDLALLQNQEFNHIQYYKESIDGSPNALQIFPCLMFGLFRKPKGSMGILNELNLLSNEIASTSLLNQLFQIADFKIGSLEQRIILLPTILSERQESSLYSADAYPITQIIGPPGTGKSYTISALAIDAISNNKSVLIVTRNVQAGKVITAIIESQFGLKSTIVKAYNQVYKRSLVSKLSTAIKVDSKRLRSPNKLAKRILKLIKDIDQLERDILEAGKKEYEWGEFYAQNEEGFFTLFKDKWYQFRKRNTEPIWRLNSKLKKLRDEKSKLVKRYIKTKLRYELNEIVQRNKEEFLKLNNALKEVNLTRLDEKMAKVDYSLILQTVPLWISTTKEISTCLPLEGGLFDVVIFDESSQCDMASAIPAIYRAKQLVVVGDPHQLRHISFLSAKVQNDLKRSNSIVRRVPDYRNESLIDWMSVIISNPEQSTYLDEHFRSRTDLIQFSNHKFYENQLKLIRSNPIADEISSLEVINTKGERDEKGVNAIEINNLIDTVKSIIEEHAKLNDPIIPSIGISSPFAEQVSELKRQLSKTFNIDELNRHKVLVGTPFHFQGEERDVMLISFCLDINSHPGSFNYLNRKDVFNVLITRAKNRQVIFTSVSSAELPSNSLLKEYLETTSPKGRFNNSDGSYDRFCNEVSDYLKISGYALSEQSTIVSGIRMDIVVLHNEICYCIDLIGYPGEYEDQFTLEDLRILNRVDVPIFFLPYSSWYLDREKSERNLINFIEQAQ